MTISDIDAWMPGVKRLVIPNRTVPLDPTLLLLHTNSNGNSTTPEQLYQSIINALNNGNDSVTRPHFDIGLDGEIVQMVPINRRGATCWHAEPWTIGIETQDGGYLHGNPDTEPWAEAQVASLAAVAAWVNKVAGISLQRGLPMQPVQMSGATWWQGHGVEGHCASHIIPGDTRKYEYPQTSKYDGKVCPGHARLAQIDSIIAAAQVINTPAIPTPPPAVTPQFRDKETNEMILFLKGVPAQPGDGKPRPDRLANDAVGKVYGQTAGKVDLSAGAKVDASYDFSALTEISNGGEDGETRTEGQVQYDSMLATASAKPTA